MQADDEFSGEMRRLMDEVEAFVVSARARGVADEMIALALEDASGALREGLS